MGKSTEYYRTHPEAREKKAEPGKTFVIPSTALDINPHPSIEGTNPILRAIAKQEEIN